MNILLVDDEKDILDLYQNITDMFLPEAKLFLANNGKEGLDFLKNNYIDLVISDINMPQMNGLDMYMSAKDNNYLNNVKKFVYITGYEDDFLNNPNDDRLERWSKPAGVGAFKKLFEDTFSDK